jgi:energy-coupling factor transporter ATP-binding protein EcfA2
VHTLNTLRISRFRNVEPGTSLRFRSGYNVLLGKNATGKTTLLELLANIISLDLSAYADEPFKIEFELSEGGSKLSVEAENSFIETSPVDRRSAIRDLQERALRLSPKVRLVIERDQRPIVSYTTDGAAVEVYALGQRSTYPLRIPILGSHLLFPLMRIPGEKRLPIDPDLFERFYSGPIVRFDESLDFYQSILAKSKVRGFVTSSGDVLTTSYLAPQEVAARVARVLKSKPKLATISIANLPVLEALNSMLGFRNSTLHVERLERAAATADSPEIVDFGNFRFEFARHDGSIIEHSRLSFGQKRLLAFHFWLATFDHFAIADELVNGLHHEWISNSVAAIDHRQSVLTTQHPLLLDYLQFATERDVAECFIVCKCTPLFSPPERMLWRNIDERDAGAFYRAYKAGIQNVSEILVSRGLW